MNDHNFEMSRMYTFFSQIRAFSQTGAAPAGQNFVPRRTFHFSRRGFFLLFLFVFQCAAGCAVHKTPLPEVITSDPTRPEVIDALNKNSAKVQSLTSDDGTIGISSSPWTAKCRLAYQRDSQFRMVGNLNMVGPVIDFGSDGDLFWFWFKNQEPNQISYCKLNEYAQSSMRDQIPVDPLSIPQALGVITIDPAEVVEGPVLESNSNIKLILKKTRPEGDYYEYIHLESKTAAIVKQEIKSPVTGEMVTVSCDEFQYDTEHGVVLPKKITISRSDSNDRLFVDLGTLKVNPADQTLTFTLPKSEELGAPLVNIGPSAAASAPQVSNPPSEQKADLTSSSEPAEIQTTEIQEPDPNASTGWGTGNTSEGNTYKSVNIASANTGNQAAVHEIPLRNSADIPDTSETQAYSGGTTLEFNTIVQPGN